MGLFASVYNMPHRSCFEVVWCFIFLVATLFIYLFIFYTEESPPFYFLEVGGRLRINFFLTLICLLISNVCQLAYR